MKLNLKKIKDWFINHKRDIFDCIFSVILCIVWFSLGYYINEIKQPNDNDNAALSNESAALCGFVQNNDFNNYIDQIDNIYIVLDNSLVVKSVPSDKWITVAPLIIEFDRYSDNTGDIYLNYPISTSTTNYKYDRIELSSSPITIPLSCYVATYSSDLWSVSVTIDYSLDYNTFLYSSSYSKTVSEFTLNNFYGLSNSFSLLDDNNAVVGTFNIKQNDGLCSSTVNYYYDYSNIPINKLICESYNLGFNAGYEGGYKLGKDAGYATGYNEGFSNYVTDNPFKALTVGIDEMLSIEIIPTFTVGDVFWICVGIVFFSLFMKIFRF